MKYNVPLEIKDNDSLSILLKFISPHSSVLEFGCANGRMTRYMKEQLQCQVYIVEYDAEAYAEAINYAEQGLCSDIMLFEWDDLFHVQFDYIVFADVLEHLSNPLQVIQRAKRHLKENGNLLVSVPNIAHNDILIKLFQENFDYTEIGLLDDTHIHFFALNNLAQFFHDAGYTIKTLKYVKISTGNTEQFWNCECRANNLLKNILNERKSGEIYQFIICAKKMSNQIEEVLPLQEIINDTNISTAKLYFDSGNGFNEEEVIQLQVHSLGDGMYKIDEKIQLPHKVFRVRIDPVEDQCCYIVKNVVTSNCEELEIRYNRNIVMKKGILLLELDPFWEVISSKEIDFVECKVEFVLISESFIHLLVEGLLEKQDDLFQENYCTEQIKALLLQTQSLLNDKTNELEEQGKEFQKKEYELHKEMGQLEQKVLEQSRKLSDTEALCKSYEKAIAENQRLIDDYKSIVSLSEREYVQINKQLLEHQKENEALRSECNKLSQHLNLMQQTVSWRITKGLRVIRKIMNKIGRK